MHRYRIRANLRNDPNGLNGPNDSNDSNGPNGPNDSNDSNGPNGPNHSNGPNDSNDPNVPVQGGLTDAEKRQNVIRLAFGGREERFDEFCRTIREEIPAGTHVILRGSAVTGERWRDGAPFDADGPGTSDLDLTLVGDEVIGLFKVTGFFVPGLHSRPLSDEDPDIAPALIPLREALMVMIGRPVNIQASRELVLRFRGGLLDQPFLTLIARPGE